MVAKRCAHAYHTCVLLTGATDVVTDGQEVFTNPTGTRMLTVNVGSGDMLSSLTAAYLASGDNPLANSALVATAFSLAGAVAAQLNYGKDDNNDE